jgi:membrane protease subunit HflK
MPENVIDFRNLKPPNMGKNVPWLILGGVVLALGTFLAFGTVFQIEPEEEGVILRFGEFNRTVEPGLHFKLPPPIEEVWKVPTQRQLKEEFGFRTVEANVRTEYARSSLDGEKLMLTGDLNVAVVEWIAQYRVKDPYKFLFKVRNVRSTFRDINEAVMRQIIGDRSVTEVLTIGRQEIEVEAQRLLQELCDEYEMGIQVEQVVLQNVTPPDTVKPSFDEVNQAQQERERLVNEAKTAFNKVIPAATGQAEETVAQARGYAIQRTNKAEGDASRFSALRIAYEKAPVVTRKRLYLEAMAEVLPKAQKKVLISEQASGVLPLLQLEGGN